MQAWLRTDPLYKDALTDVWLWNDFPGRKDFGGKDTGIDLVARTGSGDYWAIQCKCYAEDAIIDKPAVDSFLATSSRSFLDDQLRTTTFSNRLWISTTNHWGPNAEETIHNQKPPVHSVALSDVLASPVDWDALERGVHGGKKKEIDARKPKGFPDHIPFIHAIPDPHVERWVLNDSAAFKAVFGKGCAAPDQKCEKDRYKDILNRAIVAAGGEITISWTEHAEELIEHMDIDHLCRVDESVEKFIGECRAAFKALA
ncbi:MAG TPA: restriction endonuclease [Spirochaetales bacterium]|nr:restriction endonuclease [Spirochaetales bacterium]